MNQPTQKTEFQLGDLVMVKACRTSDALTKVIAKFCDIYEGPYQVIRKISEATYQLASVEEQKIRGIFNIRQLKRYHSGDP